CPLSLHDALPIWPGPDPSMSRCAAHADARMRPRSSTAWGRWCDATWACHSPGWASWSATTSRRACASRCRRRRAMPGRLSCAGWPAWAERSTPGVDDIAMSVNYPAGNAGNAAGQSSPPITGAGAGMGLRRKTIQVEWMYDANGKLDKSNLVEAYAPLVKRIAFQLMSKLPASVDVDDLIQ